MTEIYSCYVKTTQINDLTNRAVQCLDNVLRCLLFVFKAYHAFSNIDFILIMREKVNTTWVNMRCIIFSN